MHELKAVLAEAKRLIADMTSALAMALIKGLDTIDLEDRAQHMRTAVARMRLQRVALTRKASGAHMPR
ncbi:MAG: hypothetical protein NVS2B5_10730 [Beijerinckiaceae bacterium]